MDLQAAETAHKKDKQEPVKSSWVCPCAGCAKAVKYERERILKELDKIDLNSLDQLNVFELKVLMEDIVKAGKK